MLKSLALLTTQTVRKSALEREDLKSYLKPKKPDLSCSKLIVSFVSQKFY